ncbi:trimeric autotransporter adhesin [Winogradskyella eximia]|uniref:Trimeric autotransporter adhesin n=1 Tax=Winogradskyella eximia TaxID=262006 RepID=A0A3D9GZV3_9FLAO|nr:tail fiber domain-containing protein [Winogradskyella eximia]RED42123.1 trimeric autotransporter adhesin [Winogradskyella eximia]
MKRITQALLMLFTITTFAQQGINYKALIKDANNAVVANTAVTVEFSILQGVAQTNVYQETHTPTTDANGIIIINIGEGAVDSGVFADIDWASDTHFLNTQIDTGAGLTDMGTTAFNAVPYALSAKTAENVSGLEAIDEGNGLGLVKVGRVEANYGAIGENAVDLSYSSSASTTKGASGLLSTAMGIGTTASGQYSTAMGRTTIASGFFSTAMGIVTTASGNRSTAMGNRTIAESYGQTSLGIYNVATTPISTTAFNASDQLLVVGNGANGANRSNALTILKNGTITAPSFDIAEITDAKALVTKEYADASIANAASTGLEAIDEGNGLGLVKVGRVEANYGNIGNGAVDLSISTSASTTRGATGQGSTAMGSSTTASGYASTAMGQSTIAQGDWSTAIGEGTTASGFFSTAMGWNTTANAYYSTAMGRYNVGGGSGFNNIATDPLLEVGNGASSANRSNALTILKNGTIIAPSFDIAEITDDKALVTKEFADANYIDAMFSGDYYDLSNIPSGVAATGLEAVNEGNGLGLVKVGRVAANYGNVGENAVDLSYSQFTGNATGATGIASTAMGVNSIASGSYSTAMGIATKADAYNSAAIGRYNIGGGNPSAIVATDPLFEVGNGVNDANRSNALTILKNGNVGIGEISPSTALEVTGVIKAVVDNAPALIVSGSSNTTSGDDGIISSNPDYAGSDLFLRSNDAVIVYLDHDDNETGDFGIVNGAGTTVFNVNEAGNTRINGATTIGGTASITGGTVIGGNTVIGGDAQINGLTYMANGAFIIGNVTVNGSTVHSSDRRLKKEIETIPFGLKEILQLEPKAYNWKAKDQEHKSLGLIAQDVQKIITNIVQVGDDELKTMGVSYTELIPVLIKATQEQQVIIDAQAEKIKQLEAKNKVFASLEARLSALENNTATASANTSLKTKK